MGSLILSFIDSVIHRLIKSLTDPFIDSLFHSFLDSLIHCFVTSLSHWFIWLVDSLTHWFINLLILRLLVHGIIQSAMHGFLHVISLASQPPFLICWCTSHLQHFRAPASQKLSYRPLISQTIKNRNFCPCRHGHFLVLYTNTVINPLNQIQSRMLLVKLRCLRKYIPVYH